MKRNSHFAALPNMYLFQELAHRKQAYLASHPNAKLIALSVGDTTEPLAHPIVETVVAKARALGTHEGYSGYVSEFGYQPLREAIVRRLYGDRIGVDELHISDGAKCDIVRLQLLFGQQATLAMQDPTYPVYLESALLQRGAGKVIRLPCTPDNGFFPDLEAAGEADVLFICTPNNPTGVAWTHEQLQQLVAWARRYHKLIVSDAAYGLFVQDGYPRSIYEVEGAREVAIELGSFSKIAGFSGVRLGWSVVPRELEWEGGGLVATDWARLMATCFNGASALAQAAGLAALEEGFEAIQKQVAFYRENADIIRQALGGRDVYGGEHSPYVWARFDGMTSWEAYSLLLERAEIISSPGIGFGPAGEGFVRLHGFGTRATIEEAARRLRGL